MKDMYDVLVNQGEVLSEDELNAMIEEFDKDQVSNMLCFAL